MARRPRKTKYGNKRTPYRGRMYDSKAEADRAAELDTLLAAGEIDAWKPQPVLKPWPYDRKYRPDFWVKKGDEVWYEDVKGVETDDFKWYRRLWPFHGPAPLHVIKGKTTEVLEGARG